MTSETKEISDDVVAQRMRELYDLSMRKWAWETKDLPDSEREKGAQKGFVNVGAFEGKPMWVAQAAPLMDHDVAAAWASAQGGHLPTKEEGAYLDSIRGSLKDTFALDRRGHWPRDYIWLQEEDHSLPNVRAAWCQELGEVMDRSGERSGAAFAGAKAQVLCVKNQI